MSKRILSLLLVLVMLVGCFTSCDLINSLTGNNGGQQGTLPGGTGDTGDDGDTTCTNHVYSNDCDATCNNANCDFTREVTHTYTNDCDTTCNVCNAAREITHTYTNGCDTTCNVCNAERQVPDHADADGDLKCDSCGTNLACVHAWDNDCDVDCNKCGEVREVPHNYTAVCDDTCNECGATRSAAEHIDVLDAKTEFIDCICDVCGLSTGVTLYVPKQTEYNTTTSVMPSNWNELNYADNNDTQIMSYIGSSFFTYDYKFLNDKKFNEDGSINKAGIVDGAFTTNYSAATKLEDVTSSVDAKWGYTDDQKKEGGYAWKITLRDDLKWDDGTPITALDFELSMKAQLDPKFMNFRANTYYDTLMIKNSREYFFQNAPSYAPVVPPYDEVGDYSFDITSNDIYLNVTTSDMTLTGYSINELINTYVGTKEAVAAYQAIAGAANEYGYTLITEENMQTAMDLIGYALLPFGIDFGAFDDVTKKEWFMETLFYVSGYGTPTAWENVGIYAIPEENAIVVCLDKTYSFLNEDGSLSLWAAYYMSGLPLVKLDLYNSCAKEPAAGATLWTSNYNSSLATTASWGPYKLVQFEAGSHYKLEKNEYWYGWNMPTNQNQYNITAINCRKIEEPTTQWLGFLKGDYDDSSLHDFNVNEYFNSKYVHYSEGSTGTYGMQLFSDLKVLKTSANNNGILAIKEFRQAFNLGLNRTDVIEKIWPGTCTPCFGLMNTAYYYDIEGAATLPDGGKYRNSKQAMEGILRAYGYTHDEATDTWGINNLSGLSLEDAYSTLTGYNPALAKETMQKAIDILLADPEFYGYDASKPITLVYGSSVENDKQKFRATYLQGVLNDLTAGTALEGKIQVVFDASAGNQWAEAFREGKTQIGFGYGFTGNAFNPFDIVGAFVNPDDSLNYHEYWDTSVIDMTLTMPAGDYAGAGETITMSIQNWFFCLNGLAEVEEQAKTYNWSEGFAPTEARLTILAALEEAVIKESRSIMLIADSGGSFLGAKFSYFSENYNTFMGFGGLQYMVVEYDEAEWEAFVEANGGNLEEEYRKSE